MPQWGASNEYHNMFLWRYKKNMNGINDLDGAIWLAENLKEVGVAS